MIAFSACKSNVSLEKKEPQAALPSEVNSSATTKIIKKYESKSSLTARLDRLSGESRKVDGDRQEVILPSSKTPQGQIQNDELTDVSGLGAGIELLLRSERWQDLLLESESTWSGCLSETATWSVACSHLGEARAVALARTGRLQNALEIYETVASRRLSSQSAVVFAGLLADSSSYRLCATIAKSGLQWEPVTSHQELFALQARCLRLDGRVDEAKDAISLGLAEFPDHSSLMLESALLFLSEKNLTRGCELLERLYLQEFREVAVSYNWGQCLIGRKDSDAAKRVLQRGRKDWPSERLWFLLSGEVALLDGNLLNARKDAMDYISGSFSGDVFRPQAERLMQRVQGE
jgi:tetratricopeptide (TPR) repeat protein